MLLLKIQVGLALLAITCGPVLVWRRRDNVIGYILAGTFVANLAVPLLLSPAVAENDPRFIKLYATVVSIGAACFLGGLALGAQAGGRAAAKLPLTFDRPLDSGPLLRLVERRTRLLAAGALVSLAAGYALVGYVPILAADRQSAKYGIGAFREGFARGAPLYLFALSLASVLLPVTLALYRRGRRRLDLVLALGLLGGLLASLSRELTFTGPLVFAVAVAVERRARPVVVVVGTAIAYLAGAAFNGVFLPQPGPQPSIVQQVAASAPDLNDGIRFIEGFERAGAETTHGRTIVAGLLPRASQWDPSEYALRIRTGVEDVSLLASGGIRLPAPVWGYASFGIAGVVGFSAFAGLAIGWATATWRRRLGGAPGSRPTALQLTIAVAVYDATLGMLASFYFVSTGELVTLVAGLALGVAVRVRLRRPPPVPAAPPTGRRTAPALVPMPRR